VHNEEIHSEHRKILHWYREIESWSIARQGCHIATPGVTSENRAFALRIPGMRTTSMALVTF
jgi:hypothetical protein